MPIYEFYCKKCHTVFNFYSSRVNTEKIPLCPSCKTIPLKRRMSVFANLSRGRGDQGETEGDLPFDEAKMEKAMAMLADEARNLDENNPRQAAKLMRKLSETTGMNMGEAMEEMLARMEKGEDPDEIETQLGDALEGADPFSPQPKKSRSRRTEKPRVDETLYDL